MIFTSLSFLCFFSVLLGMLAVFKAPSARLWILLLASYFFYGWWDYRFTLLLFGVSFTSWWLGNKIYLSADSRDKKYYLRLSLLCSLGVLAIFKYLGFFLDSFFAVWGDPGPAVQIILPVGISFYVFQVVSYNIDIYRGKIEPERSLPQFLLYVAFFPQLVAGPIVRAVDFLPQLQRNICLSWRNIVIGSQLFVGGGNTKSYCGGHSRCIR